MNKPTPPQFLSAPPFLSGNNQQIAFRQHSGAGPTIICCGGLKSDMMGTKAEFLHEWARTENKNFVRFDYFGHGESSGRFRDGTLSRWAKDVVQIIDELGQSEIVLIGSSMGGWSSLLAALERPDRVKGLVLIAPAPDFTEKLMWANWPEDVRQTIMEAGIYYEPSEYDEPYEYSRELIEDGRQNQLLDSEIAFTGPVRILQGIDDPVVPWEYAYRVIDALASEDVRMTLVKNGDHSLSRPEDLKLLKQSVLDVLSVIS